MNEADKYCLACYFNKGWKCARFVPCYKKEPELVFVDTTLETEHDAEVE